MLLYYDGLQGGAGPAGAGQAGERVGSLGSSLHIPVATRRRQRARRHGRSFHDLGHLAGLASDVEQIQ